MWCHMNLISPSKYLWEAMLIQKYHGIGRLITEQQKPDHNPLYDLVSLTDTSETSEQQQDTPQAGHNT